MSHVSLAVWLVDLGEMQLIASIRGIQSLSSHKKYEIQSLGYSIIITIEMAYGLSKKTDVTKLKYNIITIF